MCLYSVCLVCLCVMFVEYAECGSKVQVCRGGDGMKEEDEREEKKEKDL